MVDPSSRSSTRSARDQALAWFVRVNSGHATAMDRAGLNAWLRADPRNRVEYERLGGIWMELDALPDPRRRELDPHRQASRRRLMLGAGAAVGLGALAALPLTGATTALASDYRTGTGERKVVTATDGTRIELDAATAIAEEHTADVRRLRLLEGRAMFTVAPEAARSLEVVCRDGTIRTEAGTFVVHRRAEDVAVLVEAGAVAVASSRPGRPQRPAVLAAGQCVAYGADGPGPVESMSGEMETAWRRGKLVFRDRPLDDVVADLNRYRAGRIVIGDRWLAQLRLDGIFDTAKPDAALDAMTSTLPLRAYRITEYLVILRRTDV